MMYYEEVLEGRGALWESSPNNTPAATDAFKDSISPAPGMLTSVSQRFLTESAQGRFCLIPHQRFGIELEP